MGIFNKLLNLAGAALVFGAISGASEANSLPPALNRSLVTPPDSTNLGSTSFYDAFGRTDEGFTLLQYLRYENLTTNTLANGSTNPGFKPFKFQVTISNTQVGYTTPWHPFGGGVAFSVLVPLVSFSSAFTTPHLTSNSSVGVGDIVFGPIFQAAPIIQNGRAVFDWRTQLQITAPTGNYSHSININQTKGYFSLSPYISMTYLPIEKVEFSTRINYMYGLDTSQVPLAPAGFNNGQMGSILWANFTASYEVLPSMSVGLNGYYLRQLEDNKVNGQDIAGSLEVQLYMGPGVHFKIDDRSVLNLNYYHAVDVRNDFSGDKMNLQFVHRF